MFQRAVQEHIALAQLTGEPLDPTDGVLQAAIAAFACVGALLLEATSVALDWLLRDLSQALSKAESVRANWYDRQREKLSPSVDLVDLAIRL